MVPPSPPSKREGGKGLSRMHGNGHVRFLGGGAAAMSPCYPIAADAVVEERCPPAPANPNQNSRRHAARPVRPVVSGHGRQRQSSPGSRHGSLIISHTLPCSLQRLRRQALAKDAQQTKPEGSHDLGVF